MWVPGYHACKFPAVTRVQAMRAIITCSSPIGILYYSLGMRGTEHWPPHWIRRIPAEVYAGVSMPMRLIQLYARILQAKGDPEEGC